VTFDAAPTDLLVGQSANVMVTTANAAKVLAVPSSAVSGIKGASGSVTVRRSADGATEVRTVGVGLLGDQTTEITSGLTEGDVVVLPGT
jgi:multidrug efflux pump subunit AcrA (membrane-fusion protein)